jgi:hypothetical protein
LPWAASLVNRYREDVYTWRVLLHPFDWAIRAFDEVAKTAEASPKPPLTAPPALGVEQQKPPLPTAGYLGLRVDDERRTITRDGYSAVVNLQPSALQWEIFKKLASVRDVPLAPDAIRGVWKTHGVEPDPSDGTVNDTVSELRGALKPIGIAVASRRRLGRLLTEIPKETGSKAAKRKGRKK